MEAEAVEAEAVLEAVARGIRRRVEEQRRAQEWLARFAFHEGDAPPDPAAAAGIEWRYFVGRTLRAAGDPETLALLERLGPHGRPLAELAAPSGTADRVALSDRVARLAQAGLVSHELESDRVGLTPLGEALLALVAELERRAAAGEAP